MARSNDTPRDLLFGLLALQTGMITRDRLLAAFIAWRAVPGQRLADLLVEQGAIDAGGHDLLLALARRQLQAHGGDPVISLSALDVNASTRESLARAGGPDVESTLAHVGSGSAKNGQADHTATYAVGSASGDGQRFRILRPHACGGLGTVYVALDTELHREVALKQILDDHADDPVSRQRFLVEAEITGGLEHPGIVPVYGLGTYDGGRPYYAMRFIRGDSLKDAIARFHVDESLKTDTGSRSLKLRNLLRRFTDVCNAIEYAHSRGVLHRDIKPGNVIVGKHGETLVIDWGLAKPLGHAEPSADPGERMLMPPSASGSAETLPGSALGTPAYMSPEQAAGDLDRLGSRSDVYSLGGTLYCLLTGKAPFEGEVVEVLRRVQRGDFPRPRQLDPGIDRALEAVCLKAMATRPEDRYPSCRALAEDVERWMADEPVTAYDDPPVVRVGRWARTHRVTVTASSVLMAILLPGLLISNSLLQTHKNRAEQNFRETRTVIRRFVDLAERTRDDSPAKDLRNAVMLTAGNYYEQFLRQRSSDPSLMAELAWSHYKLAEIKLRQVMELLLSPPSPPPPPSPAHTPPAPIAAKLALPPFLVSPSPSWGADLAEAARNNNEALSLYRELVERRHAPKEREYQLCRDQQRLIDQIRQSPRPAQAVLLLDQILAPHPAGPTGTGAGLGSTAGAFPMIGD